MHSSSLLSSPTSPLTGACVVEPHHGGYDEARAAWNLHADLRPAGVVTATTVAEVQAAVARANVAGLTITPQTTGHLAPALPDLSASLMIRTALNEKVQIDPVNRTARVPAGALWEDVVLAAAEHGLAAPHGSSPDVGVVGYVLGGGLSFYAREKGLASASVTAVELVTPDGDYHRADATTDPELLWALQGGGGNFGVVCFVEIDLFELTHAFAGMAVWPMALAREILTAWHEWTLDAPASVTTSARLLRLPDLPDVPEPLRNNPVVAIDGAATVVADGEELMARLSRVAEPLMSSWATVPTTDVLRIHGDPEHPVPGIGDTLLLEELDDTAIDTILNVAGDGVQTPLLFVELRQLGGALERPGIGARDRFEGRFAYFGLGLPMAPGMDLAIHAALDAVKTVLKPWDTGRVYLNFAEQGDHASKGFSDEAYARLLKVRRRIDPQRRMQSSHAIS